MEEISKKIGWLLHPFGYSLTRYPEDFWCTISRPRVSLTASPIVVPVTGPRRRPFAHLFTPMKRLVADKKLNFVTNLSSPEFSELPRDL